MKTIKFNEQDIHVKFKAVLSKLNDNRFIFRWTHKFVIKYPPKA